jgi:hypothetical protein
LDQARRAENKLGLAEHLADASARLGVNTFALALLLAGAEPEELATAVTLVPYQATFASFEGWALGGDFMLMGRSQNETCVGCTVWLTTASSSVDSVSRSISSRSRVLKAATVLAAS